MMYSDDIFLLVLNKQGEKKGRGRKQKMFDIEKMISFIIQSNTWLKCLPSFQGKMSLIFQTLGM